MRPRSSQALAGQLDAVGVVNEAIEDGVGVGGIADDLMPSGDGKLRGDDRRSAPIALFEDLQDELGPDVVPAIRLTWPLNVRF